ncbi:DUF4232 domain-containing protein [Streptomyces sp. MC1]|uniref:DUF4232 domain-containing protein n=1 Tax=Streptomyces sp. MC1 TaxID=295105 RepID=UPI0027DE7091|nr:DUF4232 domain-containing protein [Streptomyces sp. MC1]
MSAGGRRTASTPVCTARDVRVTAATQDGPHYTHIVLAARNTSGHSCRLTGFPHIQFLESHKQDVLAVAKSKPATPVVLTTGVPAYALVKLSDGGIDEDNEPVSAFSVQLEGDSRSSPSPPRQRRHCRRPGQGPHRLLDPGTPQRRGRLLSPVPDREDAAAPAPETARANAAGVRQLAVLGSPIAQALSPVLHRASYAALGLNWSYTGRWSARPTACRPS